MNRYLAKLILDEREEDSVEILAESEQGAEERAITFFANHYLDYNQEYEVVVKHIGSASDSDMEEW